MTERQKFDATMQKILSVSKEELQRRLEAEKKIKYSSSRRDKPYAQDPTKED
jgi:hypothetical protein